MKVTMNSHEDIAIPIQFDWKLFKQLSQKRKKHKRSTSEDYKQETCCNTHTGGGNQ